MNNQAAQDFTNFDYKGFSQLLSSLSPLEFGTLGCIVGLIISVPLNSNEQNSVGNFLELVGQVILTVQAQTSYEPEPSYVTKQTFEQFQTRVDNQLQAILRELRKNNN